MGIVDETAEWRSHNADEMNRVGAAMSAHLSEKGNTCVITDTGGASAKKMAAAQRMLNVSLPRPCSVVSRDPTSNS